MAKARPVDYQRKESGFAQGLFWGAALAASGMFLFATKRGKKLRDYLKKHGSLILEELEEIYEEKEGVKAETQKLPKSKKTESKDKETKAKKLDLSHIQKLQERGREAAGRFFTRGGRALK